jgi:type II secretory pathway pseudopilin PulG
MGKNTTKGKNKMNYVNEKNKKGITLIALVITIIILLILAGITINLTMGNNGIITIAEKARVNTEIDSLTEEAELVMSQRSIQGSIGTKGNLKDDLENGISGNKTIEIADVSDSESYYVTRNGQTITVSDDGTVEVGRTNKWDGTSSVPTEKTSTEIHIYKCSELKWLADQVNKGNTFSGYTIYMENNLNFAAKEINGEWETTENEQFLWTPIGNSSSYVLKATFEGNGHTISGVYVKSSNQYNGVFGNSYSIQNLTVKNSYIKGANYTAGIVGMLSSGTVNNCQNVNTTVVLTGSNCKIAGGIVGQATSGTQILNCNNSGTITAKETGSNTDTMGIEKDIGGIVGYIESCTLSNCGNSGTINGEYDNKIGSDYVGGIVGQAYSSTISNCYNTAKITAYVEVGGIAGQAYSSTISSCYNTKSIKAISFAGGITGNLAGIIEKCYNEGTITANAAIGGICGATEYIESDETITVSIQNCYNTGKLIIISSGGCIAGGILGYQLPAAKQGIIMNNYSIGEIEVKTGVAYVGGIIGCSYGGFKVENNYYIEGTTTLGYDENTPATIVGESKTAAEMKTQTFVDLLNTGLSEEVWKIVANQNNGYPVIK